MRIIFNLGILLIIAFTAFTVIYIKHKNRVMNIEIEKIERNLAKELNTHKRLLDIKTNLLEKELVSENIEKSLGMEIPPKNKIIYLDLVK